LNEDLKKFCHKYECDVRTSYRKVRRMRPIRWTDLSEDVRDLYTDMYDEQCLEITIPEDRFRTLVDFENEITKHQENRRAIESIIEEKRREHFLRNKNPALKKAYEHYQLILKLTHSDYPDA